MNSPNGSPDYRVMVPVGKTHCRACFGSGRMMTVRIGSAGQPIAVYDSCNDPACTATPRRQDADLTTLLMLSIAAEDRRRHSR